MKASGNIMLIIVLLWGMKLMSQDRIGVNNPNPDPSAILDMASNNKGFLIPQLTSMQRQAVISPAAGLLVFDTETLGFWYWDSTEWIELSRLISTWKLGGNTVGNGDFLGTKSNQAFDFVVNDTPSGFIGSNSFGLNTYFGYESGNSVFSGFGEMENTCVGSQDGQSISGNSNTSFGYNCGTGLSGNGNLLIGDNITPNLTGDYSIYIGSRLSSSPIFATGSQTARNIVVGLGSGEVMLGFDQILLGEGTVVLDGHSSIAIGSSSGFQNVANYNIAIGAHSGDQPPLQSEVTNNLVHIGYYSDALDNGGDDNSIAIGSYSQVSQDGAIVLGNVVTDPVSVGIRESAPDSKLEVNGFTKFGSAAPAIKMKKYAGNMPVSEGLWVAIPHGLLATQIIDVEILVEYSPGNFVPAGYTYNVGYEFSYYADGTSIRINAISGSSAQLLGDPLTVLITYME